MRLWSVYLLATMPLVLSGCSGNIRGVQSFQYQGGDIRSGAITYDTAAQNPNDSATLPPAGGPYSPLWQQCGAYQQPIYPEYAVHSLARGAVWVTYRPDLSSEDLHKLKETLAGQPYTLLSPFTGQSAAVVLTAWNNQLTLDNAGDSRLKPFVKRYVQAPEAPEAGMTCSGGYTLSQEPDTTIK